MPGRLPSLGSLALLVVLVVVLVSGGDDGENGGRDDGGQRGDGREQADRRDRDDSEPGQQGPERGIVIAVIDVVDGDTIEVELDGEVEDVRYIGVDTPESVAPGQPVECFGPEASDFNARLVEGERVRLVFDAERRDQYGRLLAYVYVDDRFINAALVRAGYATTLTIAPNDSHAALFDRLEQEAGNAGRGLWGEC